MERQPLYLLALEGGGTRCQAALLDRAGRLWQTLETGPVNTNFVSAEQAQQAVQQAVTGVLAAAGAPAGAVHYVATALVAAGFEAEAFPEELLPNAAYRRFGELAVVFARAGILKPHGVAVVAGTGSTAWAVRADDGREVTLGGWGSLLGDEGSAYALGLLGLRAAVRAFEGRAAPTGLVDAIGAHFNLSPADFHEGLIELAYQKPLSRTEIAALAPVVSALAGRGDALAAQLTQQVAADLADLTLHAARRLFEPGETFDVVLAGGLVNAGSLILGPVAQRLRAEFPNASMQVGWEAPAVALGRLALQHWQEAAC